MVEPIEDNVNIWPSYVDVFSAMLMVFIIVLFVRMAFNRQTLETLMVVENQKRFSIIFKNEFEQELAGGTVSLQTDGNLQNITFSSDLLFNPMSARLSNVGNAALSRLGSVFEKGVPEAHIMQIQVEGHTDARGIPVEHQDLFKSNWELSAQRAINVCKLFTEERKLNLQEGIFSATGYSSFRPLDPGDYDKNRRIEIRLVYSTRLPNGECQQ